MKHSRIMKIIKTLLAFHPKQYRKERSLVENTYEHIKQAKETWCSRYSLFNVIGKEKSSLLVNYKEPQKSFEPVDFVDTNLKQPTIIHHGRVYELEKLSKLVWPDYLSHLSDSGEIYITIGYRKSFSKKNILPMHHSVLFITDGKTQHAIFGFNTPATKNSLAMKNDYNNVVSSHYVFYDELTIRGNKEQLHKLLMKIERLGSKMIYDMLFNNCFTPVLSALSDAKKMGFDIPKNYKEHLLVVLAKEQNKGLGIIPNPKLRSSMM